MVRLRNGNACPVSYTHLMRVCEKLDVSSFSKKSFISILSISGSRAYLALNEKKLPSSQITEKFVSPGKPSVVAFTRITFSAPVSYTHLDVYKRQVFGFDPHFVAHDDDVVNGRVVGRNELVGAVVTKVRCV